MIPAARHARGCLGVALNQIRRLRRTQGYERLHITPVADTPQIREATKRLDTEMLTEDEMFDLLYQSATGSSLHSQPTLDELLSFVRESDQEVLKLAFEGNLKGNS
jgi:hypothetical protein